MKTQPTIIGLLLVATIIAGCSAESNTVAESPEVTIDHTQDSAVQDKEESETAPLKTFSVKAFRFGFEPSTLTVKQGDTVFIQVTATDVKHGFAIPEYGVNLQLEPGQEQTAVFVADKKGTFKMFCSVPCGSGHSSMQGQLVVE